MKGQDLFKIWKKLWILSLVNIHTYPCTHIYTHIYTYMYTHAHTYKHHTHVFTYTHVHTYTHTHIYTHTLAVS